MICDCGKELISGAVLTPLGNEIDYMECEGCGLVEVNGMDVERSDY